MKEFAEHGFDKASTNRIVKDAGIGKGMLFYYFKTKQKLFDYLVEYSMEFILKEYLGKIDETEQDFFERYKLAGKFKMEVHQRNPYVFSFLGAILVNKDFEIPKALEKQYMELRTLGYSKIYSNIDTSLFRDDIEVERIYKMIHRFMEGYEKELLHRLNGINLTNYDYGPIWEEFYEYLDDLKKLFYK
ncbi:MAG: TetR/AcrR family transcriptional regulator [Bacillus sp. (in: Bacteria)]|nr:TetR/AcrR family transcriptional regulator [Bacillus sp. (in: firmicutes)]